MGGYFFSKNRQFVLNEQIVFLSKKIWKTQNFGLLLHKPKKIVQYFIHYHYLKTNFT